MSKKPEKEDETSAGSQLLQSTLAIRVREARRNARLKQSDLAALVGTSQSFIYMVEAADANLTIKSLIKIAEALNVDPVHLLMSREASVLVDKNRVEEITNIVQSSLQEVHATTGNLAKINDLLQKLHKLLTEQKETLNLALPSED